MLGKLLPILLALVGLGGGIGAGLALRPAPEPVLHADPGPDGAAITAHDTAGGHTAATSDQSGEDSVTDTEFVKMNNQFVVPIVRESQVSALVVLSISFEVPAGGSEIIYQREPKLRDRFLQVLFDHANTGGFDGAFTAGPKMAALRTALVETALQELGNNVRDILITDIARQDL